MLTPQAFEDPFKKPVFVWPLRFYLPGQNIGLLKHNRLIEFNDALHLLQILRLDKGDQTVFLNSYKKALYEAADFILKLKFSYQINLLALEKKPEECPAVIDQNYCYHRLKFLIEEEKWLHVWLYRPFLSVWNLSSLSIDLEACFDFGFEPEKRYPRLLDPVEKVDTIEILICFYGKNKYLVENKYQIDTKTIFDLLKNGTSR